MLERYIKKLLIQFANTEHTRDQNGMGRLYSDVADYLEPYKRDRIICYLVYRLETNKDEAVAFVREQISYYLGINSMGKQIAY